MIEIIDDDLIGAMKETFYDMRSSLPITPGWLFAFACTLMLWMIVLPILLAYKLWQRLTPPNPAVR